jgi:hypothetical protein
MRPILPAATTAKAIAIATTTTTTQAVTEPENTVVKLDPSSPAEQQGVQTGYQIVSCNGQNLEKFMDEGIHKALRAMTMPVKCVFEKPLDYTKVLKKSFIKGLGEMERGDMVTITFPFQQNGDNPFGMHFGSEEEFGPEAGDIVLAWRKAARAWISGQGLKGTKKDLMEEACDRMDIDSNNKISVFEFHEVCLLLDGTKEATALQTKLTTQYGPQKMRCDNADKIFRMIHRNLRTGMTKAECFVGLHWLKDQLILIGPPNVIISNLDQNNDGKLCKSEFANLGKMLNPPITKPRMMALFRQLDVDPNDGFITEKELRFEEKCADPYGCGGTQGPSRMDVTAGDLKKYFNVPAIVAGRASVSLEVPDETQLPPDDQIAAVVAKLFTDAFAREMNKKVAVQDVTPFHKGHAIQTVKDSKRVRIVVINFEIDLEDGGGFQASLEQNADGIKARCIGEITKEEGSWLHKSEVNMWSQMTASYYKKSLPNGQTLYQDFGQMPGQQGPLRTVPYYYTTTVIH